MITFLRLLPTNVLKAVGVCAVVFAAVGVWDVIHPFPPRYWEILFEICTVVPAVCGILTLYDELHKDALRFLEYLPLSRQRIWSMKYLIGLCISFLWTLPCIVARALVTHMSGGASGLDVAAAYANSQTRIDWLIYQLIPSAGPATILIGGIAIVFFWYSLTFLVMLTTRWGGLVFVFVIGVGAFNALIISRGTVDEILDLRPALSDIIPLLLSSGVLMTAASYAAFCFFRQRLWSLYQGFLLFLTLFTLVIILAGAHFLHLCTHWAKPQYKGSVNIKYSLPKSPNGLVLVSFDERRSGTNHAIMEIDTGHTRTILPRLSAPLYNLYKGPSGDSSDGERKSSAWISGTGDFSYVDATGLLGLFPRRPRLARMSLDGKTLFIAIPFENFSKTFLENISRAQKLNEIGLLASWYDWRVNGKTLLDIASPWDPRFKQKELGNASTAPIEPNSALPVKRWRIIVRDPSGLARKELLLYGDTSYPLISDRRLFAPDPPSPPPPNGYSEDDDYRKPSRRLLLDLDTLQERHPELPPIGFLSSDLTKGASLKYRYEGATTYHSVVRYNLETGEETIIMDEKLLPSSTKLSPSRSNSVFMRCDRDLKSALLFIRRVEDTLAKSSLLQVDLDTSTAKTILPETSFPVTDLTLPEKEQAYCFLEAYPPNAKAAIYTVYGEEDGERDNYSKRKSNKYRLNLDTREKTRLPPLKTSRSFSPAYKKISPDGTKYIVTLVPDRTAIPDAADEDSGDHSTKLVIQEFGKDKPLTIHSFDRQNRPRKHGLDNYRTGSSSSDISDVSWLDDQRIIFICDDALWVVNADGGGLRKIFPPEPR